MSGELMGPLRRHAPSWRSLQVIYRVTLCTCFSANGKTKATASKSTTNFQDECPTTSLRREVEAIGYVLPLTVSLIGSRFRWRLRWRTRRRLNLDGDFHKAVLETPKESKNGAKTFCGQFNPIPWRYSLPNSIRTE